MVDNQKRSHVPRGQESFCCQIMAAVSFLHFNLLLWNHWAKFNLKLTGVEVSIEIEITTLCCLFLSKFIQWLIKDFFFFQWLVHQYIRYVVCIDTWDTCKWWHGERRRKHKILYYTYKEIKGKTIFIPCQWIGFFLNCFINIPVLYWYPIIVMPR